MQVQAGQSFLGEDATLPPDATAMIRRIGPVTAASGLTGVDATVRRTDAIPDAETGGISVQASDTDLLDTVGGSVRTGRFLDAATSRLPAVVLGSTAAERLGIRDLTGSPAVYLGGQWFTVIGILDPVPVLAEPRQRRVHRVRRRRAALRHEPVTEHRARPDRPDLRRRRRGRAGRHGQPGRPRGDRGVPTVRRPRRREAVDDTLTALLLGLGGVALLVGGIGIANMMVVSVLERRSEIGVRRALGATKRHIRLQFLIEAVLLALLGGLLGTLLGIAVTYGYADVRDITFSVPPTAVALGVGAALVVGGLAGLSPAARAARLPPADALRPA